MKVGFFFIENEDKELTMLDKMANDGNIKVFEKPAIKDFITHIWNVAKPYFVYQIFWPYILLNLIPVCLASIPPIVLKNDPTSSVGWWKFVTLLIIAALTVDLFRFFRDEWIQVKDQKLNYFLDWQNYPQWIFHFANVFIIIFSLSWMFQLADQGFGYTADGGKTGPMEALDNLALAVVVSLISNLPEFAMQIRIFDFFSSFVRSLLSILNDSQQIFIVLLLVVMMQTIIFFALDAIAEEPVYAADRNIMSGGFDLFI